MIDYRTKTLLSVAKNGSFLAASKDLNTTQPSVSQHIKSLEDELGVKLFDRSKGKTKLTKEGEKAVECAKKLTGIYNNLVQELYDGQKEISHLTVGVTHTAESNPIAEALAKYCAENTNVNIKMITDNIKNLYMRLKSYEIDLAIVEGRAAEEGIKYMLLDTDYLVLAVSPSHPFAKKSLVTLNELKKERLILRLPSSGTRNLFKAHLESNNMRISDFDVILEVDNIATIKDLIRRDFGVSIMARSVCLDEIRKKKIVALPVENLSMMRDVNIAYRNDFTQFDMLGDIVKSYNETIQSYKA